MKHLKSYIKEEYGKRSETDHRKKVDWYLVEYEDEKGDTYRKSFEFEMRTPYDKVLNTIPKTIL